MGGNDGIQRRSGLRRDLRYYPTHEGHIMRKRRRRCKHVVWADWREHHEAGTLSGRLCAQCGKLRGDQWPVPRLIGSLGLIRRMRALPTPQWHLSKNNKGYMSAYSWTSAWGFMYQVVGDGEAVVSIINNRAAVWVGLACPAAEEVFSAVAATARAQLDQFSAFLTCVADERECDQITDAGQIILRPERVFLSLDQRQMIRTYTIGGKMIEERAADPAQVNELALLAGRAETTR